MGDYDDWEEEQRRKDQAEAEEEDDDDLPEDMRQVLKPKPEIRDAAVSKAESEAANRAFTEMVRPRMVVHPQSTVTLTKDDISAWFSMREEMIQALLERRAALEQELAEVDQQLKIVGLERQEVTAKVDVDPGPVTVAQIEEVLEPVVAKVAKAAPKKKPGSIAPPAPEKKLSENTAKNKSNYPWRQGQVYEPKGNALMVWKAVTKKERTTRQIAEAAGVEYKDAHNALVSLERYHYVVRVPSLEAGNGKRGVAWRRGDGSFGLRVGL